MLTTSTMRKAAVAAVVAALVGVAVHGIGFLGPEAAQGHFVVHVDGGAPPNCAVVESDVLITREGWAALGVDAGPSYAFARVEVSADDGGPDLSAGDAIAGGGFIVPHVYPDAAQCVDGGPEVEVWLQGRPDSPAHCACAIPDAGCLAVLADGGTGPAPEGVTLSQGQWVRGAGCLPTVCVEMAGVPSYPEACR